VCVECGINVTLADHHLPGCSLGTGEVVDLSEFDGTPEEKFSRSIGAIVVERAQRMLRTQLKPQLESGLIEETDVEFVIDISGPIIQAAYAVLIQLFAEQELLDRGKLAELVFAHALDWDDLE
jgi:hypothetical protein